MCAECRQSDGEGCVVALALGVVDQRHASHVNGKLGWVAEGWVIVTLIFVVSGINY